MNHVLVADLGYGDAGKGTVVDWLCAKGIDGRPVAAVVRYNGGGQAGHSVVLPDGRRHVFAQFGAGTLRGVHTHLSRFMVVDPLALVVEADHLADVGVPDALDRLTVEGDALLATPYHRAANRAREIARGAHRHGSCGKGVGETMGYALAHPSDAPRVADAQAPGVLRAKLALLRDRLVDELGPLDVPPIDATVHAFGAFAARVPIVSRAFLGNLLAVGPVVFEGAQGVLLDEWHGFHPYTTWSTTTFDNAETLLVEAGQAGNATRLGVLRVVTTRHGAGPLVTEDPGLPLTDPNNPTNRWQGRFRFGHFDAVAHRYAIEVCGGVDGIALTHLDIVGPALKFCDSYDWTDRLLPGPVGDLARQEALTRRLFSTRPRYSNGPVDWPSAVSTALDAPVVITSHGPTIEGKQVLRPNWAARAHPAATGGHPAR